MAENQNQNSIKYYKKFSDEFLSTLKEELIKLNKRATGNLINSFSWEVRDFITNIRLEYYYEYYGKFVESGRKPGKFPPISAIKSWCKVKGIDESLAYPISRKIYKFGIKPTPFISDVIKSENIESKIIEGVGEASKNDLEVKIDKLVKDYSNKQNGK